ncbi:MAG TPA: arginine--tRNA ligase [Alphaproteobacteria bacterium]|nr:arginine--tRNA ligase [Alphaproteobacteria bacterium]
MNIFEIINSQIKEICRMQFSLDNNPALENVVCEPPKDDSHGDIASNAAMVLAKAVGKKPMEIAEIIKGALMKSSLRGGKADEAATFTKIEIAGAGFINISLDRSFYIKVLDFAFYNSGNFGKSNLGKGQKINIEYVSANPTGPMHIGHARNSCIGDALANLLQFADYDVTKEYYINDAGTQIEVLAKSAFLRYKEALGIDIGTIPEGLYPGEYLADIGKAFAKIHGDKFKNDEQYPQEIKDFTISSNMEMIKEDLALLGVHHDVFTSEKSLHEKGLIQNCINFLQEKGLLYRGILEAPKGKAPEDWEEREQLLFKSKEFGDDTDRPLQKSDGSYTYFTGDIAYHYDKYIRGFNKMAIVLGADHGGYVKRLKAVVKALSNNNASIEVLVSQLVKLVEDGVEVKMSKRSGKFITLREVIDTVGKDVLRFIMLTRKADQTIDFDLKKALESSKDNPVFYVQYAHARICNAIKAAKEKENITLPENPDFNMLNHRQELKLIRKICEFPRIVESSARHFEPHRITFYLYDLASEFHSLWNLGREEGVRFIDSQNIELSQSRLSLLSITKNVIALGLKILGVEPVEKM